MRPFVSGLLAAAIAVLLVVVRLHAGSRRADASASADTDFSAATLTAPPTTSWPTNGGNLYNQRYSPLKAINRDQRRAAQRRVARASARLRHRAAVLGLRAADRLRRRRVREHRRQRCVRAVDRQRRDPLAVRGEPRSEHHLRLLRLEQQGRRDQRRQGLHRPARRPARRARSRDRQSRVVDPGRALAGELLDHRRAASYCQTAWSIIGFAGGDRGTRSRAQGVRREGRPSDLDLLHDSRSRRARSRHVAEGQRRVEVRRRRDLADAGRRSRSRPRLFLDRQRRAGLQRRLPRRRQPVRGVDARHRARDRQISLALPAGASRHLGLRRGQSRRPHGRERRRPHAQGDRRSRQDRLGVHPRSRRPASR